MAEKPLTDFERQKRIAAVKTADAINAMGGVPVSPLARELSARWARGEISDQEMIDALHESHKKLAQQGDEDV